MIRMVKDTYNEDDPSIRFVTYQYDTKTDMGLLDKIDKFISDNQPTCFNCQNYYKEGTLGGYSASYCKIYKCLEYLNNPHYDCDGSKCKDYEKRKNNE